MTVVDVDRIVSVGRARARAEAAALAEVAGAINEDLAAVAEIILGCTGKVIPTGLETSGVVARWMAHLLSVTGTPALFLHPADGLHGAQMSTTPTVRLTRTTRAPPIWLSCDQCAR